MAMADAPDISKLPPHPRLWIGGVESNPGRVDPAHFAERAKEYGPQLAAMAASKSIRDRALAAFVTKDETLARAVINELKTAQARNGGAMLEIALAFDWVAPFMSDAERAEVARHVGDVAVSRKTEVGGRFNSYHNYPLQRDMGIGVAALAIAGDDPRATELFENAHKIFQDFVELTGDNAAPGDLAGRAAYGGGWPESYDYDRHGSYYALKYLLALRSATGVDVFRGSKFWKEKILYHVYFVLPNGYNVLPIDDNDWPFVMPHDREVMLALAREFRDPHAEYYLTHVNNIESTRTPLFDFLFADPSIPEHDFTDLPNAFYASGVGLVLARSGWGTNDTYAAFRASDWFTYHENDAQNVFFIYRNAPLAVKDGVYTGSVIPHFVNYTIRTISYNGITVLDPSEKFRHPDQVPDPANDGGQMIQQWSEDCGSLADWRKQARRTDGLPIRDIVDWLGFETNDRYTYAAAEAGRAYAAGKVPFFSRQFLFIYPNWVVVFDRVTSGDASFAKQFHLHAPEDMEVAGSGAVITTSKTNHTTIPGRLFLKSLMPLSAKLERVDGIATYGGKSWQGPEIYNDQLLCPHRLDITAPEGKTAVFLTAMYATGADVEKAPDAVIESETPDKVIVKLEGGKYRVSFNKTGEVAWEMLK
jgi:hypothetical protein